MIQVVKDGGVEQFEKAMPMHHWQRNKKQSVHYIHDTPFATERQLEDQRLLMQKNRNPQYLVPTKVDKVRSQTISSTMGASRPEAVKANVLNKIVREASGVHNYTIVAPVRTHDAKKAYEKLEPETNPRVRPYAQEAKLKPVLCSFGHRPRSASRTFHPATMKFRLKHGEIAHGGDNVLKTGFGLPVSVLAQVLHAPKLYHPSEGALFGAQSEDEHDQSTSQFGGDGGELDNDGAGSGENYEDLFFSAEEHAKMFKPLQVKPKPRKSSQTSQHSQAAAPAGEEDGSLERPSWVSSVDKSKSGGAKEGGAAGTSTSSKYPIVYPKLEPISYDGRPKWNEAHHRTQHASNELFQLRASGLSTGGQAMPLSERLKRFASLSVAETQPVLFCTEKQETDKLIMSGAEYKVPKSKPHGQQPLFFDPSNNELQIIKHYRKQDLQEEHKRREARQYQKLLKTIPKVDYFPTTRLAEMQELQARTSLSQVESDDFSSSFVTGTEPGHGNRFATAAGGLGEPSNLTSCAPSQQSKYSALLSQAGDWQNVEHNMKMAMKAAKSGDRKALYECNMRSKLLVPIDTESDIQI